VEAGKRIRGGRAPHDKVSQIFLRAGQEIKEVGVGSRLLSEAAHS